MQKSLCLTLILKTQYKVIGVPRSELKEIQSAINQLVQDNGLTNNLTFKALDKVDATKNDDRVTGQFDEIYCLFPTPRILKKNSLYSFGHSKLDLTEMLFQIRKSKLLTESGLVHIATWIDTQMGTYECNYRLARAQKKNSLRLKSRNLFDIEKYRQLGYQHIKFDGSTDKIRHLPILSSYQQNQITLDHPARLLSDSEYEELSDSEDLAYDAMPARNIDSDRSKHRSKKLNFFNKIKTRTEHQSEIINAHGGRYSSNKIIELIEQDKYREAEIRINRKIESINKQKTELKLFSKKESAYQRDIIEAINKAYKSHHNNEENKLKHAYPTSWYAKLKILTGLELVHNQAPRVK